TFTGKMRQVAHNDYGVALRLLFFIDPQGQWQQMVQQISRLSGFGGDVSNVTATDPTATGKPFEYSYDYTRKNYGDWANHRIVLAVPPISLATWTTVDAKTTKPLTLGSPDHITLKSTIELPTGYTPTLPPAVNLSRSFAEYHATYSFRSGVLYAERDLIIKKREVPAAQRAAYQSFAKSVTDDEEQFITLAAATASAPAPPGAEVRQLIQQARQAYAEQDFGDALDDIQRAVKMAPKYAYAWMMLGSLEMSRNERDDGEAALRKAISLAPKEPTSYTALALYLARTGHTQEAMQVWRDLLKQDPDNVAAHANLGALLLKAKKYEDAVTEFNAIAKENGQNKSFEINLGMAALGARKTQVGITALESAAKLDPSPYTLTAVAYQLANNKVDLERAQNYAQRAAAQEESATGEINLDKLQDSDIQLMNGLCAAWDTVGWVYFQQRKLPEAEKYLEAAWVLGEGHLIADHLGQVYEKQGRKQEALHMYALAAASLDMTYGKNDPNLARLVPQKAKRDAEVSRAREEVSRLRQVRLGKVSRFIGSAEFWVLFAPGGKIEGVKFASGADQLRSAAKAISLAHLKAPLPDDAPTKILRRGVLVCEGANLGCDFTLLDISSVHFIN
ncbi:MAG: tetratricopeptide repeat protein, partial [Candidatus Acidiferrales bacterium]